MKKFTFMLIATLFAAVGFAQKPLAKAEVFAKTTSELHQKQMLANGIARSTTTTVRKAPRKALGLVTPPEDAVAETYYTVDGSFNVYTSEGWQDATSEMSSIQVIVDGNDIYIAGLAYYVKNAWIKGTIDGTTATFPQAQQVDDDESYPEWISGSDDGGTLCDIVFDFDQEAGTLKSQTTYIGECAVEDAFSIYAYWAQPSFSKEKPAAPEVVVAPEGLVTEEYSLTARNYNDNEDVSGSVYIGFDDNDVYIQGLCTYIPDAWVKGTLDGTTITFPSGQYFGSYADAYDMYLNVLFGEDVVFTYDAEAGTLTAQNECFLIDNSQYYFDSYRGCVIKKVIEKAAMPANPEISAFEDSNWGYRFTFNIPNTDIDGNGLVTSKLYYKIYTDINTQVAPLTFTPATHSQLTEELTEIPYGFTENYDIYSNRIYLNDLYSEDWNKIGIQSIYYGGGETNATEIQWFTIKEYTTGDFTFNFNEMDVPTSTSVSTDGDINETLKLTAGSVTLAVSPKTTSSTANRFWGTNNGPQLRVYSGTLTFTVPAGYVITGITFNHNGKWGANTVDGEVIPNDADAKVATWTGSSQTVVVSIAANSQIDKITVTVAEATDMPVTVSDALYATYVAPVDVDFTGAEVSAYAVQVSGEYAHLEPVTTVPAGTAVVVKAEAAGTYKVALTTSATLGTTNELVAATEDVTTDGTQYVLAKVDDVVGFYQATGTIAAGKGYLVVSSPVKGFYGFEEDDATAISRIAADENAIIYNLAGQRVSKAVKGINIINGKKVLK